MSCLTLVILDEAVEVIGPLGQSHQDIINFHLSIGQWLLNSLRYERLRLRLNLQEGTLNKHFLTLPWDPLLSQNISGVVYCNSIDDGFRESMVV